MKVVLTGGGTGGHIYPALAVAKRCKEDDPQCELLYIGTTDGLESDIVPQEGLPFEAIQISGFKRSLSMRNFRTIWLFVRAVRRSKQLLRRFRPDVVVGTGGYVCGPVVYAAAKLGIPTVIHEQNVDPGLTNRFLSKYADVVAVSFEGSESRFPQARKVVYTGNPRATEVVGADAARGRRSLGLPEHGDVVVVVGGSRGAQALNDAMVEMADQVAQLKDVHFVYITGKPYYEHTLARIKEQLPQLPLNLRVIPYVNNMPEVLAATSLIITRSGASFLAEITALGIPSIQIPSPNVTNNHQEANARRLADAGAAELILERDLQGELLFSRVERMITDSIRRESMALASKKLGLPDAADRLIAVMQRLV